MILPILLLLVLGIVEFGILLFNYNTIASAAREGARAGVIASCDADCVEIATKRLTTGLAADNLAVNITYPASDSVRVAVTYNTSFMTAPLIAAVGGSGAITLQSTATMNRE
ncbi:MAG: pilus assembly protein [Caldilineaceae bacterium]|nr:pilus assembly protein [Caldilineaceae bacterium]